MPYDLRRDGVRQEYLENHKKWFLKNHENATQKFEASVKELYAKEADSEPQMRFLETEL